MENFIFCAVCAILFAIGLSYVLSKSLDWKYKILDFKFY